MNSGPAYVQTVLEHLVAHPVMLLRRIQAHFGHHDCSGGFVGDENAPSQEVGFRLLLLVTIAATHSCRNDFRGMGQKRMPGLMGQAAVLSHRHWRRLHRMFLRVPTELEHQELRTADGRMLRCHSSTASPNLKGTRMDFSERTSSQRRSARSVILSGFHTSARQPRRPTAEPLQLSVPSQRPGPARA